MILYYITDRTQFPGTEQQRRDRLLAKIAEAARCGVDMIQLREKDLPARALGILVQQAVRTVREAAAQSPHAIRLLINSRVDVAIAAGADGVHLRSGDITASEARVIFSKAGITATTIAVSCHSPWEVRLAEAHGADYAVFGPVFAKSGVGNADGISSLRQVCRKVPASGIESAVPAGEMPVLALGGVALDNAAACVAAGATGIAGIRLFQDHDLARIVPALRAMAVNRQTFG